MDDAGPAFNVALELQTRFLCPFCFRRASVRAALETLLAVKLPGRDGKSLSLWEHAKPHDLYREELLDHVVEFLFPSSDPKACGYLKISNEIGNRWFNKLHLVLRTAPSLPEARLRVRLVEKATIELFLSEHGVGVLSVGLRPDGDDVALDRAVQFNYRLSQLRWSNVALLETPAPPDGPHTYDASQETKEPAAGSMADPAPVIARLGKAGSSCSMPELVEELLRPLKSESFQFRDVQDRLSVYTAVRFDSSVDFEKSDVRYALAPFLSALAQVEEPGHAGTPRDVVGVSNRILNRRHWAGVGLLGAAHLLADQPPPDDTYNPARMPRIVLKYFVPYLVALLQRLTLHRVTDEAGKIILSRAPETPGELAEVRSHLLEFAANGYFSHVSTREALHRYYRMCQDGVHVRHALDETRQAIAEIDAKHTSERQTQIAEDTRKLQEELAENVKATKALQQQMAQQMGIVAHVQVMVEWIEIFLVSVYAAHLCDMIASHIESAKHYAWLAVIAVALVGGALTAAVLKPWRFKKLEQ